MFANWYSVQIVRFCCSSFFTVNVVFAVCTASRKHCHFYRFKDYTSSMSMWRVKFLNLESETSQRLTPLNINYGTFLILFFFLTRHKDLWGKLFLFLLFLLFLANLAYTNTIWLPEVMTYQSVNRAKRPRRRTPTFDSSQCPLLGLCPGGRQRYGAATQHHLLSQKRYEACVNTRWSCALSAQAGTHVSQL